MNNGILNYIFIILAVFICFATNTNAEITKKQIRLTCIYKQRTSGSGPCFSKGCYCKEDGTGCSLLRNPTGSNIKQFPKDKCGCLNYDAGRKYFSFDFTKSGDMSGPPLVDFEVKSLQEDGTLKSDYKIQYQHTFIANSQKPVNKIPYTFQYCVDTAWDENDTSDSTLNAAAESGAFCPPAMYAIHDAKKNKYTVFFCGYSKSHGVETCEQMSTYVSNNKGEYADDVNKAIMYTADFYDTVEIYGSVVDKQEEVTEDIEKEKEEIKTESADVCDKNSANYNAEQCLVLENISGEKIDEYDADVTGNSKPNFNFLSPIHLGKLSCDTVFKNSDGTYNGFYYLFWNVLKMIKYAAIALTLGLSLMDFIKVISSGDKDELKKSINRSIKRLIIGVIIFFAPTLLNFVLNIIGDYTTCNLL